MNSTRRAVLSVVLVGCGLVVAGCTADAEDPVGAPAETATAPEPAETTSTTPTGGDPLGGGREVEIRTYAATFLAPSVEGGVVIVEDPAASEVPAQWVLSPIEAGGTTYLLTTVALTDGESSCLTLAEGAAVSLAACDAGDPAQRIEVTSLDGPEQVALSTSAGHLGVDPASGTVTVFPSGDQLSSTFTLVAR